MYELALSEWGLTPEYLNRHWTEELLARMFQVRASRLQEQADPKSGKNWVSEGEMMTKLGTAVKRVKAKKKGA